MVINDFTVKPRRQQLLTHFSSSPEANLIVCSFWKVPRFKKEYIISLLRHQGDTWGFPCLCLFPLTSLCTQCVTECIIISWSILLCTSASKNLCPSPVRAGLYSCLLLMETAHCSAPLLLAGQGRRQSHDTYVATPVTIRGKPSWIPFILAKSPEPLFWGKPFPGRFQQMRDTKKKRRAFQFEFYT